MAGHPEKGKGNGKNTLRRKIAKKLRVRHGVEIPTRAHNKRQKKSSREREDLCRTMERNAQAALLFERPWRIGPDNKREQKEKEEKELEGRISEQNWINGRAARPSFQNDESRKRLSESGCKSESFGKEDIGKREMGKVPDCYSI